MIEMKHINLSFRDKDLFTDQEIKLIQGNYIDYRREWFG